jgi:hypothetical protein
VQEHRPLRDADLRRDVLDTRAAIALIGEVSHGDVQDQVALALGVAGGGLLGAHRTER